MLPFAGVQSKTPRTTPGDCKSGACWVKVAPVGKGLADNKSGLASGLLASTKKDTCLFSLVTRSGINCHAGARATAGGA